MSSSFHTSWSTILSEKEIKKDKKRLEKEFADAWDLVNEEKWKLNLKVANDRKAMTKRVDSQLQFQNETLRKKKQKNEVNDVYGSLNKFETTLAALDLNDSVRLATPSSTIANEIISNDKDKLQRHNNRRQKFIRDFESTQATYFNNTLNTNLSQQVLQTTQFENAESSQIISILQSVTTYTENRKKRNQLLDELIVESNEKTVKLLQEMVNRQNEYLIHMEKSLYNQRIESLESYDRRVSQSLAASVINDVVNDAIDAAEWISSWRKFGIYQELMTSNSTYNTRFYESTSRLFKDAYIIVTTQNSSFSKRIPSLRQHESIDSEFIQSLSQNDLNSYFDTVITAYNNITNFDGSQHTGESLSNPNWLINTPSENVIGEVILRIEDQIKSDTAITVTADNNSELASTVPLNIQPFQPFPFRVIITGVNILLRKKAAYLLQSKVSEDLTIISVEDLLSIAIEYGNQYVVSHLDQQSSSQLSPTSESLTETQEQQENYVFHTIAIQAFELIQQGHTITDDIYCKLIKNKVSNLPDDSLGYILYDYPNTRKQASELIYALSGGIDYDQRIPQLNDIGSNFSVPAYRIEEFQDPTKCGLNLAIVIESPDISTTVDLQLQQRIRDQSDELSLFNTHQLISDPSTSVLFPTTPHNETISMDILIKEKEVQSMKSFFKKLDILKESKNFLPSDSESLDTFVDTILQEYDIDGISNYDDNNHSSNKMIQTSSTDQSNLEEVDITQQPFLTKETQTPYAPLPTKLSVVLSDMWKLADKRSTDTICSLFNTIRMTQYRFILRRRFVYDSLLTILNQPDIREKSVNEYAALFNSVDIDFRFEDTFKAEMLLKSMELFQLMNELSLNRKNDANKFINTISNDGILSVLIHSIYTSAVTFTQAHYSRYITNLNILFDYTKAVFIPSTGSDQPSLLEETLDYEVDTTKKGGTNKAKVSKADSKSAINFTPYRNPIPSDQYLPIDDMKLIPDCNIEINLNIASDKLNNNNSSSSSSNSAADKAKLKKAKQPSSAVIPNATTDNSSTSANQNLTRVKNTLLQLETKIEENLKSFWSQDTFTLNRTLYHGSDEVAESIEKTIWFESSRLLQEIKDIRSRVDVEVNWFIMMESSFSQYLTDQVVETFYAMEMTENRSLNDIIEKSIDDNTTIILE